MWYIHLVRSQYITQEGQNDFEFSRENKANFGNETYVYFNCSLVLLQTALKRYSTLFSGFICSM